MKETPVCSECGKHLRGWRRCDWTMEPGLVRCSECERRDERERRQEEREEERMS